MRCSARALRARVPRSDADPDSGLDPDDFKLAYTLLHDPLTEAEKASQEADGTYPYHQYGDLAREGVSCAVCHRIAPPPRAEGQPDYNRLDTYLMNGTTGVFRLNPADELNGPYEDVRVRPMQKAMGITPVRRRQRALRRLPHDQPAQCGC